MAVWVRSSGDGKDAALLFRLHKSRHLTLRSIAAHWGLDPATLLVGRLALSIDDSGNSLSDVDEIRAYSSAVGLGDGLTDQTPFVITGKPARKEVFASSSTKPPQPKEPSEADKFATAAAVPEEVVNKLRWHAQAAWLRDYRGRLLCERAVAMREELFYDPSGIHCYCSQIDDNLGPVSVAAFVGTVHVVPKALKSSSKAPHGRARGMATLVRLDGYCLTADVCVTGFDEKKSVIVVNFPRMGDSPCSYKCKIAKVDGFVVHLEAVEQQSFKACMAADLEDDDLVNRPAFIFDGHETMQLVECPRIDSFGYPVEVMVLPSAKIYSTALGGPAFDFSGNLKGVVVDVNNFLKTSKESKGNPCVTRSGGKMQVQSTFDLQHYMDHAEKWKKIHNELDSTVGDAEFNIWSNALRLRRVVEYVPSKFTSPTDDWLAQHPLSEYIKNAMERAAAPRLKFPSIPKVPFTEEQVQEFYKAQQAVKKYRGKAW